MNTKSGDIVLDSFLGSGTTAAVAHKMNRRYIGIEMGDHAYTHCKLRLDKVIDGSDQGGISKSVNWQGGGALVHCLVIGDTNTENIKIGDITLLEAAARRIREGASNAEVQEALAAITPSGIGLKFLDPRAIGFRTEGAQTLDDPSQQREYGKD